MPTIFSSHLYVVRVARNSQLYTALISLHTLLFTNLSHFIWGPNCSQLPIRKGPVPQCCIVLVLYSPNYREFYFIWNILWLHVPGLFCLSVFHVLATSNVISGWVPIFHSVHSWWRYSAAPRGNEAVSTMTHSVQLYWHWAKQFLPYSNNVEHREATRFNFISNRPCQIS